MKACDLCRHVIVKNLPDVEYNHINMLFCKEIFRYIGNYESVDHATAIPVTHDFYCKGFKK